MFMTLSRPCGATPLELARVTGTNTGSRLRRGLFNPRVQFLIVCENLDGDWLCRCDCEISQWDCSNFLA